MVEMLAKSNYEVRVMDLNPQNIGQIKYGIKIENGADHEVKEEFIKNYADIIFCTGSTLANGTITDYLDIHPEVHLLWHYSGWCLCLVGAETSMFFSSI